MFFKKKPNYTHLLTEFIDSFALLVDPIKILTSVKGRLLEFFNLNNISYLVIEPDLGYKSIENNPKIVISQNSHLINWLTVNCRYLKINDIIEYYISEEIKLLKELEPEYIFPLEAHNKIVALAIINTKELSDDTLNFFYNVFRLTAIAYENAYKIKREKKKIEEEHEKEKMAVIGKMASLLAHEIKNPLTAIRAGIQFLQKISNSQEIKDITEDIIDEVDRVNNITNSLLQFARPQKVIIDEFKIIKLLRKIEKLYHIQIEEANIKFSIKTEESDDLSIKGDIEAFQQIFINLLLNSIDALYNIDKPTIEVKILEKNNRFFLEWEDNGKGISPDKINKIFNPFFTDKKKGNGLGLTITKRLLENQDYSLKVNSKIGKGTKFYFNIDIIEHGRKW